MFEVNVFEMSVNIYITTRFHFQEDISLNFPLMLRIYSLFNSGKGNEFVC
jgi:hypothetical protein